MPPRRLALVAMLVPLLMLAGSAQVSAEPASRNEVAQPVARYPVPFSPIWGPVFNNPLGDSVGQRRILNYLVRTVDATPGGAVIRVSVWAFGDRALLWALQRAHERGVFVRMVIDGHRVSDPSKQMRRLIGNNPSKKSFIVHCRRSCRGTYGQNHTKFFTFSRSGGRTAVTLVTSANATGYNVQLLWNDLYSVAHSRPVFRSFGRIFAQMKRDRPVRPSYVHENFQRFSARYYPFPAATDTSDPTLRALKRVRCHRARGGAGAHGRTRIRVAMSAWHGTRGLAAARKLGELADRGCGIRAILGSGSGPGVRDTLRRNDITFRRSTKKHVHTHQKMMLIMGHLGRDRSAYRVFTGSHNWTDPSLQRDEVVLGIKRKATARLYFRNFRYMWRRG